MVHVVFCVNGIHVVSPLNPKKYRSISISSPCRFYFVLYCFIGFSWSPLPLFVPLRPVQSQRPLDVVNRSAQSRCPPVGTEEMSTGHLVVFASLRSVQSGHPPDVLHPCIFPYQSFKLPMKGTELDYGMCKMCLYRKQMEEL